MNVCKCAGIVVLISLLTLAGKLRADDINETRIEQLRAAEVELDMLKQSLGPSSPQTLEKQAQVEMWRQRILSDVGPRRDRARRNLDVVNQQLHEAQEELRRVTGRTDVSLDSLNAVIESLDKEREELLLESAVADARWEAIEDAIGSEIQRAQDATAKDTASHEIQMDVDALQERLKVMQEATKSGLNTPADVLAAQASLAEAQTKLAERRSTVTSEAGGSTLAELNHDLVDARIATAERNAKMEFIKQRLITLNNALRIADEKDFGGLLRQREAAEIEAEKAAHDWQVIQDEISSIPTSQPAR